MAFKVDPTVRRESLYIAAVTVLLSAVMQAVYLIIGQWNVTVLLGNLLGGFAAVLNFFLMGLTVQKVLGMEEKDARTRIRTSQHLRMLMLAIFAVIGAAVPCFDLLATLLPLLFPRIGVTLRPLMDKKCS